MQTAAPISQLTLALQTAQRCSIGREREKDGRENNTYIYFETKKKEYIYMCARKQNQAACRAAAIY
jgi:hypothetical protein